MASSLKRTTQTPALLPWIPPGKPDKDKSFNAYATKKNSKAGPLDLGKVESKISGIWKTDNERKDSKNSLGKSKKTESRRNSLRETIKEILEEGDEENEEDAEKNSHRRRRTLSEEGRRSRSSDGRSKDRRRTRSEERDKGHRSRSRRRRKHGSIRERSRSRNSRRRRSRSGEDSYRSKNSRDHDEGYDEDGRRLYEKHSKNSRDHDEGYDEDGRRLYEKHESNKSSTNKYNKGQNGGHFRSLSSSNTNTSGIGSLVEDIEDRQSIEFIDNVDLTSPSPFQRQYRPAGPNNQMGYGNRGDIHHDQFGAQLQVQPGYGYQQFNGQPQFNGPYNYPGQGFPGQFHPHQQMGFQNNNQQLQQPLSLPHHLSQSMPQSDLSYLRSQSPSFGFTSMNLTRVKNEGPDDDSKDTPEAWIVFPKAKANNNNNRESVRSFTAKPLNLAASIGSRLKESFTNINQARSTPVEPFTSPDQDKSPEDIRKLRKKRRKQAYIAGGLTAFSGSVFFIIMVGSGIASTNNGKGSGEEVPLTEFLSSAGQSVAAVCINKGYKVLNHDWRKIASESTVNRLFCDDGLEPGWYRFQEPGGKYLPTNPPGKTSFFGTAESVCGTNKVAWLDGAHPKVHEGVKERKICLQYTAGPCENSYKTNVTTCRDDTTGDTYYLYYLQRFNTNCQYGYCAV